MQVIPPELPIELSMAVTARMKSLMQASSRSPYHIYLTSLVVFFPVNCMIITT